MKIPEPLANSMEEWENRAVWYLRSECLISDSMARVLVKNMIKLMSDEHNRRGKLLLRTEVPEEAVDEMISNNFYNFDPQTLN
jgi:hypothetical protein